MVYIGKHIAPNYKFFNSSILQVDIGNHFSSKYNNNVHYNSEI